MVFLCVCFRYSHFASPEQAEVFHDHRACCSEHYQQHYSATGTEVSFNIMARPALLDDIFYLLCEKLASQEQFDTLFNCDL
jgi:hypothetical protein